VVKEPLDLLAFLLDLDDLAISATGHRPRGKRPDVVPGGSKRTRNASSFSSRSRNAIRSSS
jgi:hypothetical protein